MPEDDLPGWLPGWCADHLGEPPVRVLFQLRQMSLVVGLRLDDGVKVVVKARPDDGRAGVCVAVQAQLAERGFPCAGPLTSVVAVGALAVHAEQFRPGGQMLLGDSPAVATRYAAVFAELMAELEQVTVRPPWPNPRWVRWDHPDPGLWPALGFLDERDQGLVPSFVLDTAARARARLRDADLACVLGHADFEAQNLRWHGRRLWAVHDWDSLAWQPEAALVGAASGAFPRGAGQPPRLPPMESSEAFLAAYQQTRKRRFSGEEHQVAWAASLWSAAHHARWEALMSSRTPLTGDTLRSQAVPRLARAGA